MLHLVVQAVGSGSADGIRGEAAGTGASAAEDQNGVSSGQDPTAADQVTLLRLPAFDLCRGRKWSAKGQTLKLASAVPLDLCCSPPVSLATQTLGL